MACRFPGGADDLATYWDTVCAAKHVEPQMITSHAFDFAHFGLSKAEAATMDPHQGVLLEVVHEALTDAGLDAASPPQACAVVVGQWVQDQRVLTRDVRSVHTTTGASLGITAARVAHIFDLRGEASVVDTACSSSLVALARACDLLHKGACDYALVGGVNLLLDEGLTEQLRVAGFLSPTGRCHSFDAAADGYARAEGAGVVVLARRGEAAAGDVVAPYAEVWGACTNQDGRSATLTAPNPEAQRLMLGAVYGDGDSTRPFAIECHGTGTKLGDPIEVAALREAFGADDGAPRRAAVEREGRHRPHRGRRRHSGPH